VEAVATAGDRGPTPAATRVLMVCSRASGGMARHVVALLAGLQGEGYELAVACDPVGMIADAARERSLPVYGITFSSSVNPTRAMLAAWQLSGAISGFQAHLVHTHSYHAGLVGAVSTPLARPARMVATIHGYPPNSKEGQAIGSSGRLAMRLILRRAARVIFVSEALRQELAPLRPEPSGKQFVIPNGVNVHLQPRLSVADARRKFGLPTEAPIIGLVARLAPQKGILEYLRSVRLLCDRHPTVHAVLVGEGPLEEEARALQRELRLGERLHLLGKVDPALEVMWALDVLVVASVSEGSSIVAMEGMALSKPVVATSVGGVPEVVLDGVTGRVVPPGDPEALAEAVAEVLDDPETAQAMGERGRQRAAREFDTEAMVARTKEVYADLMREMMAGSRARK
jgi:glycosyltransferase involved in cell wall biosynthesis